VNTKRKPRLWRFLAPAIALLLVAAGHAGDNRVLVLDVRDVIDYAEAAYIRRGLDTAAGDKRVVFALNTPGGAVDATLEIKDAIFRNDKLQSVAFVEGKAWSAGALITLACDRVYMMPGSTIGSAAPVIPGAGKMEEAGEKYVSAIRAQFRAVAERKGRNGDLAAAMVDKDMELYRIQPKKDGPIQIVTGENLGDAKADAKLLIAKGKLLNLTADAALELGLIDGIVKDREALAETLGVNVADFEELRLSWSEHFVRFLNSPVIAGLLLTLGLVGIYTEFKVPGFGLPGIAGIICLALLLGSKMFVGLAGWLELAMVFAGLGLLAIELFVIPGFGLAGISGIILTVLGLVLAFLPGGFNWSPWSLLRLQSALLVVIGAMMASMILFILLLNYLPNTSYMKRIILETEESPQDGYTAARAEPQTQVGQTGLALTALRPAGIAEIDGRRLDVVTQGEFIQPRTEIEIAQIQGARIIVRPRPPRT